jgi:hypothetical protein
MPSFMFATTQSFFPDQYPRPPRLMHHPLRMTGGTPLLLKEEIENLTLRLPSNPWPGTTASVISREAQSVRFEDEFGDEVEGVPEQLEPNKMVKLVWLGRRWHQHEEQEVS